jgi:multifunctional methyltransferase subunit TRM112
MRILSHNFLCCNVKGCDKNNFPLAIFVEKSQIIECEYKNEPIVKLIPKLEWNALYQTVIAVKKI